jgi:ADP-heptose:LPS heptosyltransferase
VVKPLPETLAQRFLGHGEGLTVLALRMGALGDVLRTLPPVRLLRFAFPDAKIYWVVDDRWAPILTDHPDLDGCFAVPRREWSRLARSPALWVSLVLSVARFAREVRSAAPDIVLDFHGNLRSGVLGRLSGAAVRLGYSGPQQKEGNRLFTTHRVDAGPQRMPRMERNLALLRALGVAVEPLPDGGIPFSVPCLKAGRDLVAGRIGRGRPYAVIVPGASAKQSYKKPPAGLLAAAAREIRSRGVHPLVLHGPGEESDAIQTVRACAGAAALAPPTDLRMLAAVVRRARLLVAGDTGPLHLACAVGCPVVAIYGPTDPEVNAPWGVPHAAVSPPGRVYTGVKRTDREAGGFEGVTPEAVAGAVREVLDRASPRRLA